MHFCFFLLLVIAIVAECFGKNRCAMNLNDSFNARIRTGGKRNQLEKIMKSGHYIITFQDGDMSKCCSFRDSELRVFKDNATNFYGDYINFIVTVRARCPVRYPNIYYSDNSSWVCEIGLQEFSKNTDVVASCGSDGCVSSQGFISNDCIVSKRQTDVKCRNN